MKLIALHVFFCEHWNSADLSAAHHVLFEEQEVLREQRTLAQCLLFEAVCSFSLARTEHLVVLIKVNSLGLFKSTQGLCNITTALLSFRGCSWWPSGSQIVLLEVCVRDPSEKYFQECSAFVSCLLFAVLFGQSCLFLSLSRRPIWWMSVYECHYVWVLTAVGTGLLGKTLSLCNSWSLIQHIKH